jgi:hypothetical protein
VRLEVDVERSPDREQLRPMLGTVVDELTERSCRRVLGAMRAAARREVERAHRFDGQLTIDAA